MLKQQFIKTVSGLLLTFFRELTKVKYENTCKGKPGNSSFKIMETIKKQIDPISKTLMGSVFKTLSLQKVSGILMVEMKRIELSTLRMRTVRSPS